MSAERRIAVVDQGSTSTKGGVYTLDGECILSTSRPVERRVAGPSVRNNARRIADDVEAILVELAADGRLEAIGLACQRSTCLLWDRASGEPLSDTLSWQDRSQAGRVDALSQNTQRRSPGAQACACRPTIRHPSSLPCSRRPIALPGPRRETSSPAPSTRFSPNA